MASINLLPNRKIENKLAPLKKNVYLFTSIALVIYIVVACSFLGWWLFLKQSFGKLDQKINDLSTQIRSQSTKEALVLEIFNRSQKGDAFLKARPTIQKYIDRLTTDDLIVESWTYAPGQTQILQVKSSSAESVEKFATSLKDLYPDISISELRHDFTSSLWVGQMELL